MSALPFAAELANPDLIAVLAGLAAFITVLAVWSTLLERDRVGERLKALAERRHALKAGLAEPVRRKTKDDRKLQSVNFMRKVAERLNLMRSNQAAKMTLLLAQAGWRSRDAVVVFVFLKVTVPILCGGGALFAIYGLDYMAEDPMMRLLVVSASLILVTYGPDLYVRNIAQKRREAIIKSLPDTLDLLVICAEAGLSLDAALTRVARETMSSAPELADEVGLTAIELSFIPDHRKALENLNARTEVPSIRGVVNTLIQTERFGTPLAQALRVLSAEFRDERMMRAEEKAARLPATLTVPLIIFILPTLFTVLLGPAIIQTIDTIHKL